MQLLRLRSVSKHIPSSIHLKPSYIRYFTSNTPTTPLSLIPSNIKPNQLTLNLFYGFIVGITLTSIYNREIPGYERRIRRKAKKGNALAMVEYGEFLLSKKDEPNASKNRYIPRAFNLFQSASEQGNKTGHYYLGLMHKMEIIETPNPKAAFHHFTVSSMDRDEGDPDTGIQYKTITETLRVQSKYELGLCYLEGYGCDRDCNLGLIIMEDIGKNNGDAAYMLSHIYANGRYGVSINSIRALSWKKESAKLGNKMAIQQMNEMYMLKGREIVDKDVPSIHDYDSVKSPM